MKSLTIEIKTLKKNWSHLNVYKTLLDPVNIKASFDFGIYLAKNLLIILVNMLHG